MVNAGDAESRQKEQDDSAKRTSPGLLIGCHIDVSTGILTFTVNGQELPDIYYVEPGAILFPAVFCGPTNKEVFQFELGRTKVKMCFPEVICSIICLFYLTLKECSTSVGHYV